MKPTRSTHDIPIIIINWNGLADTLECIESVLAMKEVNYTIYLVDNGSEDGQARQLADQYKDVEQVKVIALPQNIGFAKANNLVLEKVLRCGHKYVALLNNDTLVEPNWLFELVKVAEEHEAQVVSSKLIHYYHRNKLDNVGHQMLNTGEVIPIGHGESPDKYQDKTINFGSCAAGTLYATEMLQKIGYFDPFFSTGYEDAELGVRAAVAGYRCLLAPDAIVYHKVGQSIGKIFDHHYTTMIQEGIWYTYLKLMPWPVLLISLPFILFKIVALTLVNLLTLRFKYVKIMWKAIYNLASKHRRQICSARRDFKPHRLASSYHILSRQRFFLLFDLKRFVRIYIKRQPSALDRYGL